MIHLIELLLASFPLNQDFFVEVGYIELLTYQVLLELVRQQVLVNCSEGRLRMHIELKSSALAYLFQFVEYALLRVAVILIHGAFHLLVFCLKGLQLLRFVFFGTL